MITHSLDEFRKEFWLHQLHHYPCSHEVQHRAHRSTKSEMYSRKNRGSKLELPRHRNFRTTRKSRTEHVVSQKREPLRYSQGRMIIPGATVLIPSTVESGETFIIIETPSVSTQISALHFWRRCHCHCLLRDEENEIMLRTPLSSVYA
jgi:hypothetical protein